jgi:zona occludens toxin (predicted ATPase)
MTIHGYVGLPGEGKTYEMVRQAMVLHRQGRTIYSNIPLNLPEFALEFRFCREFPYFKKVPVRLPPVIQWKEFHEIFNARCAVILIDEASIILPAQAFKNIPPEVWVNLRQHRHKKLDMYFTAQSFAEVGTGLRRLTQYVTKCKRFGTPNKPWFFMTKTISPHDRVKYGTSIHLYDESVALAYDTMGEDVELQTFARTGYGEGQS